MYQQNHVNQRPNNPVLESKQQVQYPAQTNQMGALPRQQAGPGDQLTQNSTAVRQSFQHVTKPQQVEFLFEFEQLLYNVNYLP